MCNFGSGSSGPSAPSSQMTTQTTSAAPEARAMYNTAWERAQAAASNPFQIYSTDPNAFVAGLNPTQTSAIGQAGATMGAYQPYYGMAGGLAGAAGTTSTADVVGRYMSPYTSQVLDPITRALQQQQAIQTQQQKAEQIKAGAFGQQRGQQNLALLRGQQNLALGQTLSPLLQTGYGQALGAAQTDLARQLQAGQTFGQLGTGAQQAAGMGVQTGLLAGSAQQQTEQAMKDAMYRQFQQQQAYPFLTSQFLTQAAQGLGPGYGQTSTGVQQSMTPLSFFGNPLSDPKAKVGPDGPGSEPEVVGETYDGQKIYRYCVVDPDTGELGAPQIGLMADEAGERRPDAVGERPDGLMTLDYARATDDAAEMGKARMGGAVTHSGDYARGGLAAGGFYGAESYVPVGEIEPMHPLSSPSLDYMAPQKQESGFDLLKGGLSNALGLYKTGKELYGDYKDFTGPSMVKGAAGSRAIPTFYSGGYVPESGVRPGVGLQAPALSYTGDEEEDEGGGGLSDTLGTVAKGVGLAKGLYDIASVAGPALMALSDPRMKTGVRPHAAGGLGIRPGNEVVEDTTTEEVEETPRGGFDEAVRQTLKFEGGLNPNDAGRGPSNRGINQAAHPGIDVTKLTEPQTRDIYYNEYWKGVGADQLPENVRNIVYDTAVMAGPRRAKQLLEVAGTDPEAYMGAREKFLNNLVANDPDRFSKYAKSWANRNQQLRDQAGLGTLENLPEGARDWMATTTEPAKGFGERLMSKFTKDPEMFLIPALAGLGTMASSGSRFLAPAILQGVGGGAKAYAELAQQQFEREKMGEELGLRRRAADISEKELGLKQREYDRKMQGAQAIAKALSGGSSTIPYGTPSTGGAPAVSTRETPPITDKTPLTTGEAATMPAPSSSFWADVDPQSNPHALNSKADQFERAAIASSQAGDPEYTKSLLASAQQYRTAANSILKEGRVMTSGGVKLLPGFSESAATMKKAEAEAEAGVEVPKQAKIERQKAEIGREFAPVVSTTGTEYIPPVEAAPVPTAPAAPTETSSPAPGELPPDVGPPRAVVEPKTGVLATAIPKAPPGGGMQIDPSVPAGAKVSKLSPQNAAIVAEDQKFFGDFVEKQPNIDIAIQRFNSMAKAFKMVQSGATEDKLGAMAAIADTYGYKDLAKKIAAGEPSAVEWINKNGVNLVLDTLKAATPRFAQQEFTRIADQGVPSAERLPDTNFKMVSEGMGALERQKAFAQDWAKAKQQGWASPSAFWTEWSQSNPLEAFVASAERRLGNFKGMPLPPSTQWTEGTLYVVPKGLVGAQANVFRSRGMKPGDVFRFNGRNARQAITPVPVGEVSRAQYGAP